MVTLKLHLDDAQARKYLDQIRKKGIDLRPAMKKIAIVMIRSVGRQFHLGGIPKWKPLSDVTIERRRKKSHVPLRDTGRLGRSWGARGMPDVRKIGRANVIVGSNVIYAAVHQYGRPAMRGRVPEYTRRITTAFGRKIEPTLVTVQSHETTLPKVPKRPVRILPTDLEDAKLILTDYLLR